MEFGNLYGGQFSTAPSAIYNIIAAAQNIRNAVTGQQSAVVGAVPVTPVYDYSNFILLGLLVLVAVVVFKKG